MVMPLQLSDSDGVGMIALAGPARIASDESVVGRERVVTGEAVGSFSLSDVSVAYGKDRVIEGVSMEIPAHAVTALIGPSAAASPRSFAASIA